MIQENHPQREPPALIDAEETRRRLGIGKRLLAQLTAAGEIPSVKIGRRRLYDPVDLAAWIESRKTRGPAAPPLNC